MTAGDKCKSREFAKPTLSPSASEVVEAVLQQHNTAAVQALGNLDSVHTYSGGFED